MSVLSGETSRAPRMELNELAINGKKGKFYLRLVKNGLVQVGDKKVFEKQELGEEVSVVFLRIRRQLRAYRKNEKPLTSIEHNTKFDRLILYGADKIEIGSNDELREKYQGLRTQQVVYCLLFRGEGEPELVRLRVRGSALGSQNKAKEVHDFYSYISSFKDDGQDLHFYDYYTILKGVEEMSDMGEYYAMTFVRGEAIGETEKELVYDSTKQVYDFVQAYDTHYKAKTAQEIKEEAKAVQAEDIETIEYPEDEDKVGDIPF